MQLPKAREEKKQVAECAHVHVEYRGFFDHPVYGILHTKEGTAQKSGSLSAGLYGYTRQTAKNGGRRCRPAIPASELDTFMSEIVALLLGIVQQAPNVRG